MLNIQQNIPLKNYTTFRVGGPAKYFVEVSSGEELLEALKYAKENNLDFFILGGGSNLLVSDKGYDGIVIQCRISNFQFPISNSTIEVGAGIPLAKVVNESVNNGLTGLEWAAGIPGTMGGAVRGNAGAFGGSMMDVIESVKTYNTGDLSMKIYDSKECKFGYRSSVFKKNQNLIILSVVIKLQPGDKEKIQNKVKEIIAKRITKQPKGMGSAGSYFTNPVVANQKLREEFERSRGIKCKDEKLPAGWLIDQAGLRSKKVGGAMVSREHANFIINTGGASAEDVIMLVSIIKQQVKDKFGIELQEEVQYLGF